MRKRISLFVMTVLLFFFPIVARAYSNSDFVVDFSYIHYDVNTTTKELLALQLLLDKGVLHNTSFHDASTPEGFILVYHDTKKGLLYVNPKTGEFQSKEGTFEYSLLDEDKENNPQFKNYEKIIVHFGPFNGKDSDTLVADFSSYQNFLDSSDAAHVLFDYLLENGIITSKKDKDTEMVYFYNKDGKMIFSRSSSNEAIFAASTNVEESDNISVDFTDFNPYFVDRYGHSLPECYKKATLLFHEVQMKKVVQVEKISEKKSFSKLSNIALCFVIFLGTLGVCAGLYFGDCWLHKKIIQKQS